MEHMDYHLAEINIAKMRAPLDDARMAEFVDNLEPINALAEESPGFVWRLQSEEGDATSIRIFDDEMLLINLSVWEGVEQLKNFVYKSRHVDFVRRRGAWFEPLNEVYYVLWWVPRGHIPTLEEARARLEYAQQHGDSSYAFSFRKVFLPGEAPDAGIERRVA